MEPIIVLKMYKQYIDKTDNVVISMYQQLCSRFGCKPIVFTDKLLDLNDLTYNIAIFHTLYIKNNNSNNNKYIVFNTKDMDILIGLGIKICDIVYIDNTDLNINDICLNIG